MTPRPVACDTAAPISVKEKLRALGEVADEDRWQSLQRLAHLLALKIGPEGSAHLGHWWRGPLLYSLVRQRRPSQVLEVGTGRGYGAVCMAQALLDAGLDGTVWTIDRIPPDQSQLWALDEGQGVRLQQLSLEQVWAKHLSSAIRDRIRCLTGESTRLMARWQRDQRPQVDFCFIDGGHEYRTVKHDFLSALKVANPPVSMLFDDYTDRRGYGVRRVIHHLVLPTLPAGATVEIIDLLCNDRTVFGEDVPHQMALLHLG